MNAGFRRTVIVVTAAVMTVSGLVMVAQTGSLVVQSQACPPIHNIAREPDNGAATRTRPQPSVAVESPVLTANTSDECQLPRKADLDLRGMLQKFDERTMAAWMAGVTFAPVWTRISLMANCNEVCDEFDNRLVHIAARSGNYAALWVLMRNGADPDLMNMRKETSLQIVRSPDRTKRDFMIACLLQHTPERIPETLAWFHAEDEQRIPARIGVFSDGDSAPKTSWLPVLGQISLSRQ